MTTQYGPTANAYYAFKSMMYAPSAKESIASLVAYLQAEKPQSPLLEEALKYVADPSELEYDFNRMCIGPYKLLVAPYESVYLSGNHMVNTKETAAVADFYQQIGLTLDEKQGEPADYIGNELEFLYCVHALASEQKAAGNVENAAELQLIANEFMQAHLGLWYVRFCEGMQAHATLAFWRLLATELHDFITDQVQ
ncbi:molecular chaperone [Shewanella intestini]|uniref:Molecular chaperone TorD family protein n=1 Tax=Shewanella intestini TaxID=2017544 RepID=A0ABS5I2B7_9GAMM|nr:MULTISPECIES: molecular chaperone TorD family protein [Shewanella]MBR9728160.1 molecular chaperone TorD family protein [Shewanella intestini]MRG36631.1 molecular chaperone TorD [Shewanella sp. XMDDZSB0408]